jgi:hypothetical protein
MVQQQLPVNYCLQLLDVGVLISLRFASANFTYSILYLLLYFEKKYNILNALVDVF